MEEDKNNKMKKVNKNNKIEGNKIKVLEVTAFSSGFCGIWMRVKQESELLVEKGYDVTVFSSNIHRGTGKIEYANEFDELNNEKNNIKIHRFKTKGNFGENTFFWDYEDEALKLKPNIIICHAYRQYYSTKALKIAKKLGIPCILVTHAPFLDKKLRSWKLNLMVWIYDNFVGRIILNKYSKIFTITKWEIPYLLNLGVKKEKIIYMPNGVPKGFYKIKIPKTKNKLNNKKTKKIIKEILFLGRIAPIKDVETLIKAFKLVLEKKPNTILNLVGPVEEDYGIKIKELIKNIDSNSNLEKNVKFLGAVYELDKKIKIIDNCDVFVLSSKREGMPQSLVEVMSREKIAISSDIQAGKEVITNGENGYLFSVGDEKELYRKIMLALEDDNSKNKDPKNKNKEIKKNARKSIEKFAWNKLVEEIDKIIREEINVKEKV